MFKRFLWAANYLPPSRSGSFKLVTSPKNRQSAAPLRRFSDQSQRSNEDAGEDSKHHSSAKQWSNKTKVFLALLGLGVGGYTINSYWKNDDSRFKRRYTTFFYVWWLRKVASASEFLNDYLNRKEIKATLADYASLRKTEGIPKVQSAPSAADINADIGKDLVQKVSGLSRVNFISQTIQRLGEIHSEDLPMKKFHLVSAKILGQASPANLADVRLLLSHLKAKKVRWVFTDDSVDPKLTFIKVAPFKQKESVVLVNMKNFNTIVRLKARGPSDAVFGSPTRCDGSAVEGFHKGKR